VSNYANLVSIPTSLEEEQMNKLTMLQEILAQNPTDSFARYGLAMEYAGSGQTEEALAEFDRLAKDHPDYVPGYFMAAQTFARVGRTDEAKNRLQVGIAAAVRTGNAHAEGEMQDMLDELS
jgi:predicted Zn-dependent protease